ncbi:MULTISPECIES: type II secretion system protein N [Pseudomonadaceae]|uniref:type II secretion system protein N n=1 Tax=Pseudomonadaceae TaxID=135621 RepID=UPI00240E5FFD|nr:type II secretion system protein N [Pseudomonas sp. REST10]|tara:strand:- start:2912 stop:3484 length:573 start_codon:yes stop_codon:yes gene_type:complete
MIERLKPWLLLTGLFFISAAYCVAFFLWQHDLSTEALPAVLTMDSPAQSTKPDHVELVNLFGTIKSETAVAPVKESALSLKLVASYVGGKQGRSAAVIAQSENSHKLYYPGDQLMPGVELVDVQVRRVLIKRNGALESVSLEERQQPALHRAAAEQVARLPAAPPAMNPISQQKLTEKLNKLQALANGEI